MADTRNTRNSRGSGAHATLRAPDVARSVLDNLLEGCQVVDRDFRYLYVNDALVRQGRTSREALLGATMPQRYPGIEQTLMFGTLRRCMEERCHAQLENEFTFPDGSTGWFELRFEPVPEGIAILSVDITARKQGENVLRRTVRVLRALSQCNQLLARVGDESSLTHEVCTLLVEMGEYAAAWIELDSEHAHGQLQNAPHEHATRSVSAHAGSAGSASAEGAGEALVFDLRVSGAAVGTLSVLPAIGVAPERVELDLLEEIAVDLGHGIETLRARTEHERIERQLVAAQKLEAVGRLAGGVAHDFNNLLSVILTYGELAVEHLPADHPTRSDVEQIVKATKKAAGLTKQLLAFGRRQLMEPRVTCLNAVIADVEIMLRSVLGKNIDLEINLAADLGNVLADPGHVEQVLMNLALNARDAMPEGGKLTIETRNVELDEAYSARHLSTKPGPHVLLSVADTGEGIPHEFQAQIFEPFFTTKEPGKGTGLGLSMVYGIVKKSGGAVWVYSEPAEGTAFKIYLPRVFSEIEVEAPSGSAAPTTGSETILLVEENPQVRDAAQRILSEAGYEVWPASNGTEALLRFDEEKGAIDLLLTDLVMPNMSGKVLAQHLDTRSPGLRVLYMSGYTDNVVIHHGKLEVGTKFLEKPFSPASLTAKVRSVLDGE